MTLVAGIVSRKRDIPVAASFCETLAQLISRNPADRIHCFQTANAVIARLDIGAFREPAIFEEDDAVTMVTGEPLLRGSSGRSADGGRLHEAFLARDAAVLREATGVFNAVHWNDSAGELTLVTDKLGIRPMYYILGENHVVFAGALRVLEGIDLVPRVMDVRSVTELVGLGYILGERTPYADIRLLRPAEMVRFTSAGHRRESYWRWDEIEESGETESEHLDRLYTLFRSAVRRRNGNDKVTSAYLSGGLDSRCIVAALRADGVSVETYNFARPQTQDLIFGREFARAAGTNHHEVPKPTGDMVPDYSQLMADAIAGVPAGGARPERPQLVWSGEGGSVALGHVHMTEQMADWMRSGETGRVAAEYIGRESASVAPRLFSSRFKPLMDGLLEQGITQELGRINSSDPARSFYLFLLLNDQHRKLARHFENIDLHRLELQLPFFDSEFIEAILRIPLDLCLRHRLYVKWLAMFPPEVTHVPWQAYPGHESCPVPVTGELAYQWADAFQTAERSTRRRHEAKAAARMLRSADFPTEVLSLANLALATIVHRTGFRNYQYLLGPAAVFHEYWQKCGGRFVLPGTG